MDLTQQDIDGIRKYEDLIPKAIGPIMKGRRPYGMIGFDDLWAAAHEGLILTYPIFRASFPERNEEFTEGYLVKAMKSYVRGEIRKNSTVKKHAFETNRLIEETEENLSDALGRAPTKEEICRASGISDVVYETALKLNKPVQFEHLEYETDGEPTHGYIPDQSAPNPFRVVQRGEDIRQFHVTLKSLSDLEQKLVRGIALERKPKQDVYKSVNVSCTTGIKHYRAALIKLSDHILFKNRMAVQNFDMIEKFEEEAWMMGIDGFEILKWGDTSSVKERRKAAERRYRDNHREELNRKAAVRESAKRAQLRELRKAA